MDTHLRKGHRGRSTGDLGVLTRAGNDSDVTKTEGSHRHGAVGQWRGRWCQASHARMIGSTIPVPRRGQYHVQAVSFFEPLRPEPPRPERHWAPPAWDRPSEGTLPAILPVGAVVHQTDTVTVAIESLGVYPNGFTVNVAILLSPHSDPMNVHTSFPRGGMGRMPRIGVRFADGRTGGRQTGFGRGEISRDAQGLPTEPFVGFAGGGGGGPHGWHFSTWVYPLPPDGPLEIFVSLPAASLEEASATVDGSVVRETARRAKVIWS
jgi:hypothetical protein